VQGGLPRDSFEIDGDGNHLSVVQRPRYEAGLDPPLMPSHPQANVLTVFVLLFIELQPSFELDFPACNADFAGEADKLQFSNRGRNNYRPGPGKTQGNH
jgi:hypothetical protein